MEGFIFVFLFISVIAGPVRKSRIPLLDHMRTPLFAELDMTYTNEQLEKFILSEVENEVNEVNDTNRKIIKKLIKSEIFKVKELIKYELGNLRTEMLVNYSSELDSMRESFKRRISALENVSQYTEMDSMKESFERRISALENISQCTELEQNLTKEKNVQVKATVNDVKEMKGDCYNFGQSKQYKGIQSTTISGRTCQYWNTDNPHKRTEKYIPQNPHDRENNFCMDTSGSGALWCYTTDPDVRWEYCPIPICDCYKYGKSKEYDGVQSTTISGRTCQHWNTDTPHKRTKKFIPANYNDRQSNYCRDTSDAGALWCYTTDPDVRWEFCPISIC